MLLPDDEVESAPDDVEPDRTLVTDSVTDSVVAEPELALPVASFTLPVTASVVSSTASVKSSVASFTAPDGVGDIPGLGCHGGDGGVQRVSGIELDPGCSAAGQPAEDKRDKEQDANRRRRHPEMGVPPICGTKPARER